MLDTRFPRILGDVGNPESFDFPVAYHVVEGATPEAIVLGDQRIWAQAFVAAAQKMVAAGCKGLATTCGFMTLLREQMVKGCGVPVAASSLEQVAGLAAQRPGILTISAASLGAAHLRAAQVPVDTPVAGLDGSHFARAILGNQPDFDVARARVEMVAGARRLCSDHPEIGAIVLECTNMPPYAADIERATGRPVYSILTHLTAFHATL